MASAVPADAPQQRRARFDVALSLIELRRFDGASKELTTLHAQQPSTAVSNALGVMELRRAAPPASAEKAAPYFERATHEAPGETDYLFNLGYAKSLAGDRAGALLWLRETVRYDAADGDAHLVMGAVLASSGRTAEALRELDLARLLGTALETVPATLTRVPPSLERVHARLDDSVLATPALSAPAQRDQSETAEFHLARGRNLVDDGRDREAVAELQRSIYLAPYEDEPHLLLGRLYERAGRLGEAIDEFKVALWCRETVRRRVALGRAFFESGDREAARREFDRALVLAPDSAEVRDWLQQDWRVTRANRRATIVRQSHVRFGLPRNPAERQTRRLPVHVRRRGGRRDLPARRVGGPRRGRTWMPPRRRRRRRPTPRPLPASPARSRRRRRPRPGN